MFEQTLCDWDIWKLFDVGRAINVTATVIEITKSMLHMRAEVKNVNGELVAISQLINYFVKPS